MHSLHATASVTGLCIPPSGYSSNLGEDHMLKHAWLLEPNQRQLLPEHQKLIVECASVTGLMLGR